MRLGRSDSRTCWLRPITAEGAGAAPSARLPRDVTEEPGRGVRATVEAGIVEGGQAPAAAAAEPAWPRRL